LWLCSPFKYAIGATKDDAGVQKEDAGLPQEECLSGGPGLPARSKVSQCTQYGLPCEGRAPRPGDSGPEDEAVCSGRILSAAAWRTRPAQFSELSLPAAAPEDVPAKSFVGVRVSKRRRSVGRLGWGAAFWHPGGTCPQKISPISVFWRS